MVLSHSSRASRIAASQSIGDWVKGPSAPVSDELRALEAPAEIEEAPAGAARHVLLRQARQRGDEAHDLVERREQRIEVAAGRHQALAHLAHQRAGRGRHVDGEAIAQRAGEPLDGVEHGGEAALVGGDGVKALLEGRTLRRRQRRGRLHQVGLAQQPAEQAQLDRVARAHGALRDPGGGGAQQAGVVVEPLDVAAEPDRDCRRRGSAGRRRRDRRRAGGSAGSTGARRRRRPRPAPRRPSACR